MEARGFCPSPCEFLQTDLPTVLLGFLHSMVAGYKVKVSGDSSGNQHNFPSPIYWWFVCRIQISGRGIYYFSMTGETAFGGYILPFGHRLFTFLPMQYVCILWKKSQRLHLTPASGTRSRYKISSSKSCLGVDKSPQCYSLVTCPTAIFDMSVGDKGAHYLPAMWSHRMG